MIDKTMKKLETFETSKNIASSDVKQISDSVTKLKKTAKSIQTIISDQDKKPTSLTSQIESYTKTLREQTNISDDEKIHFLQAKLRDLTNPLVANADLKALQKEKKVLENKLIEINKQLDGMGTEPSKAAALKKDDNDYIGLIHEKAKIQEKISGLNELEDLHPERIYQEKPFIDYKEFVNELNCYPHAADKEVLLMSLIVNHPKSSTLEKLQKDISDIKENHPTLSLKERKKWERQLLVDSELFSGAFPLISARKLGKKLEFSRKTPDSRALKLTRAAAKIFTASGFGFLSFVFPKASFTLFLIPGLLKSSLQEVKSAWNGTSEVEQAEIIKEMKTFVEEIKKDPKKVLDNVKKQYDTKTPEGEKIVGFVKLLITEIERKGVTRILEDLKEGKLPKEEEATKESKDEVHTVEPSPSPIPNPNIHT
jgi:hypothetical protein